MNHKSRCGDDGWCALTVDTFLGNCGEVIGGKMMSSHCGYLAGDKCGEGV